MPSRPNAGSLTARDRDTFLTALEQGSSVRAAARLTGRQSQRFYDLRRHNPLFAARWDSVCPVLPRPDRHPTEAARRAARREQWRAYKAKRRLEMAGFPSPENYAVWRQVSDPLQRWWLERLPLSQIVEIGANL